MATNYERGRAFEYRVRDKLLEMGATYVMRAAQSKGKVDLLALWPMIPYEAIFGPWIIQCKRDGRLSAEESAELIRISMETGAVPMLAKAGKNGRGVEFVNLFREGDSN